MTAYQKHFTHQVVILVLQYMYLLSDDSEKPGYRITIAPMEICKVECREFCV